MVQVRYDENGKKYHLEELTLVVGSGATPAIASTDLLLDVDYVNTPTMAVVPPLPLAGTPAANVFSTLTYTAGSTPKISVAAAATASLLAFASTTIQVKIFAHEKL